MSIETNFGIARKKLVIRSVKEFATVDAFNMQVMIVHKRLSLAKKRLLIEMRSRYGYSLWYKR